MVQHSFLRTSPPKGFASSPSIARRMRARSLDERRLRDFCAGPARATSHGFLSAEFIKGDVVPTFVCGPTASNSSLLGRGRSLFWELPNRNVDPERLKYEFGAGPVLFSASFLDLLCHRGGD